MPRMPTSTSNRPSQSYLVEYYQHIYHYLSTKYESQIERAILVEPIEFRRKSFKKKFVSGQRLPRDTAWEALFPYLQELEDEMTRILRRHSPGYWWHIYRRIAPTLHPKHVGKTDAVTAALVRRIADLAIVKHSSPWMDGDLIPSTEVNIDNYLSGMYNDASVAVLGSKVKGEELFRTATRFTQWVVGRLSPSDFIDMYRLEGLSYEYWKTTAALRGIGKGAEVELTSSGWFKYHLSDDQAWLFDHYDSYLGTKSGISTFFGTWVSGSIKPTDSDFFTWAQYNVNLQVEDLDFTQPDGSETKLKIRPNFRVGRDKLSELWANHKFADNAFKNRNGFSFRAILTWMWMISVFSLAPEQAFKKDISYLEQNYLFSIGTANLKKRGYAILHFSEREFIELCKRLKSEMGDLFEEPLDDEIDLAFEFLSFSEKKRDQVGLWAGGKRFPIVTDGPVIVIDLGAMIDMVERLFFKVGDKTNKKGTAFEDVFREHLKRENFEIVHIGELRWPDGQKREVDAAVRISDTLVLLECVSPERPLDFEIARPKTYDKRVERLQEKLEQAGSLASAISDNPKGKNFDFSWSTNIDFRVVSPQHEFLWTKGEPCFDNLGKRRILNPEQCSHFLLSIA